MDASEACLRGVQALRLPTVVRLARTYSAYLRFLSLVNLLRSSTETRLRSKLVLEPLVAAGEGEREGGSSEPWIRRAHRPTQS